jgi:hypothetical protein
MPSARDRQDHNGPAAFVSCLGTRKLAGISCLAWLVVVVYASLYTANAIILEAALSFLGLGVRPRPPRGVL